MFYPNLKELQVPQEDPELDNSWNKGGGLYAPLQESVRWV